MRANTISSDLLTPMPRLLRRYSLAIPLGVAAWIGFRLLEALMAPNAVTLQPYPKSHDRPIEFNLEPDATDPGNGIAWVKHDPLMRSLSEIVRTIAAAQTKMGLAK